MGFLFWFEYFYTKIPSVFIEGILFFLLPQDAKGGLYLMEVGR